MNMIRPPFHLVKIVLVEDHTDVRNAISRFLTGAGANVTCCKDALEGFEAIQRERPDLALLDIMLPQKDGFDLIRDIRALAPDKGGNIPAIALTALSDPANVSRAHQAGFQAHLGKPCTPDQLVTAIRQVLETSQPADGSSTN